MRTLLLTRDYPPRRGGIARLYSELCERFPVGAVEVATVGIGHAAEAATGRAAEESDSETETGDSESETETETGVARVHRMGFGYARAKRFTSVIAWTRWTARRLDEGGIDLLQVGDIRPSGYVAAWLHARRGVPYVIHVHGLDVTKEARKIERSPRARWTGRRILGGASGLIANSAATAERAGELLDRLDIDARDRVHVVHPGTDPTRFRPDAAGAARWRARLGAGSRPVVLTVARLVPRKGIDTTLEALARLQAGNESPRPLYVVAGTGPDAERLARVARELNMAEDTRFLGDVAEAELPSLYAAADVFVLAAREEPAESEVEGFGIVYCEAQAAGVPVIGGDSGGVRDAVPHGSAGWLVPPRDTDALATALSRLLADPALRRRMGREGRRAVERHYNWDRAAAEAWSILESAAAAGGAGSGTGAPRRRRLAGRSGAAGRARR